MVIKWLHPVLEYDHDPNLGVFGNTKHLRMLRNDKRVKSHTIRWRYFMT